MEALSPLLKEFGFPLVLCGVLMWAIKHMAKQIMAESKAHINALKDRVDTLESIVTAQGQEIHNLQEDRLRRADEYARTLKDIAGRYSKVVTDHDAWSKQAFALLSRLIDIWQVRPCMLDRMTPAGDHAPGSALQPKTPIPSSAEMPTPPRHDVPTERQ